MKTANVYPDGRYGETNFMDFVPEVRRNNGAALAAPFGPRSIKRPEGAHPNKAQVEADSKGQN
jgi:hypothetical protein